MMSMFGTHCTHLRQPKARLKATSMIGERYHEAESDWTITDDVIDKCGFIVP